MKEDSAEDNLSEKDKIKREIFNIDRYKLSSKLNDFENVRLIKKKRNSKMKREKFPDFEKIKEQKLKEYISIMEEDNPKQLELLMNLYSVKSNKNKSIKENEANEELLNYSCEKNIENENDVEMKEIDNNISLNNLQIELSNKDINNIEIINNSFNEDKNFTNENINQENLDISDEISDKIYSNENINDLTLSECEKSQENYKEIYDKSIKENNLLKENFNFMPEILIKKIKKETIEENIKIKNEPIPNKENNLFKFSEEFEREDIQDLFYKKTKKNNFIKENINLNLNKNKNKIKIMPCEFEFQERRKFFSTQNK